MNAIITVQRIECLIYSIRDQNVLLDSDLAELYGITTSNLNKADKRNQDRFPGDFMFQLTKGEFENLRFHIGISNQTTSRSGRRYLPHVFTEQGVVMLSSVLNSKRAVQVNIEIMRTFVRLRQILLSNKDLSHRLDELVRKYDTQFKNKDFKKYEYLLFAENTPIEELKEIVMTLAHLPTKRAQSLLTKFCKSVRAKEVEWLEPAMDEGKILYIWLENDEEESDMLALKLYHKMNDQIIELMGEADVYEHKIRQYEIEKVALEKLQNEELSKDEKEDIKYRIIAIADIIKMEENHLDETKKEIIIQEKIIKKIKEGISTERYKNMVMKDISGFSFDGEV